MLVLPEAYIGHAAGLATSVLWTFTSLFFTAASRRIGPTAVNATRIGMAVVLLGVTHRIWAGSWVPEASGRQVTLLALSGLLGLSLGDQALLTAFVAIGPRLAMLIMTTAPLLAALFGWLALDEMLSPLAWIGVTATVGGVAWVVLERPHPGAPTPHGHRARGLLLAFVAATCQAGGYLLSKAGLGHGWLPETEQMNPQAATLVRMVFAACGMVPVVYIHWLRGRARRAAGLRTTRAGSRRTGTLLAFGGSLVGPYLGVWMSLVAAHHAPLAVAQTLCSLPPIFVLPFARLVYREPISLRAVLGALVAVGGVTLLFVPKA